MTSADSRPTLALLASSAGGVVGFEVVRTADRSFALQGELDLDTVALLEATVIPVLAEPGNICLDLGGLEFMGSDGLRAFINFCRALGENHVILEHVPGPILKVLEITGVVGTTNIVIGEAGPN